MKIEITRIPTDFNGKTCYTHARGYIREDGFGIMTTQPIRLSGMDIFYGMYISKTYDGGKTWSPLMPSKTLTRKPFGENYQIAFCDATPMLHKKSGKIILVGQGTLYVNDEHAPSPSPRYTIYAVYDESLGDFGDFKVLSSPLFSAEEYFSNGNGSGQYIELDDGDLLIPIYHNSKNDLIDPWKCCYKSSVLRCSFDGESLEIKKIGNPITTDLPRGLYEPSIIKCNSDYYLALRNDATGYIAKSRDGLNFDTPTELVWDSDESIGNYNTQQHLISVGGKLYIVYTRRADDNDNVPRHRAPLFISEFDTEKMCLIQKTEKIVVPNRGARLGNFGTQSRENFGDAFVFASEWMQTTEPDPYDFKKCMRYGSDNSIFVTHISF